MDVAVIFDAMFLLITPMRACASSRRENTRALMRAMLPTVFR